MPLPICHSKCLQHKQQNVSLIRKAGHGLSRNYCTENRKFDQTYKGKMPKNGAVMEPHVSCLPWSFPLLLLFISFAWMPSLTSPRRWSLEHRIHLPVLFQRNHPQVWRVLQHHLCHQVSSNWPCLIFPCLFTNVSAKFPIIIFRPAVFQ